MSGISTLSVLLSSMAPELKPDEYVFVTLPSGRYGDGVELQPVTSCVEREGLSLTAPRALADARGLTYDGVFRMISLHVHSSLEAVGLTAAISACLTAHNISANVVAGHYHDHLFVPAARADDAMAALESLT